MALKTRLLELARGIIQPRKRAIEDLVAKVKRPRLPTLEEYKSFAQKTQRIGQAPLRAGMYWPSYAAGGVVKAARERRIKPHILPQLRYFQAAQKGIREKTPLYTEVPKALGLRGRPAAAVGLAAEMAVPDFTPFLAMGALRGARPATRVGRIATEMQEEIAPLQARLRLQTPVQRVITALQEAKPIRAAQEALYTKARGERIGAALRVGKRVKGEKGFYAELGELKGEMPKVIYESLRGKIGQTDIDDLFEMVKRSDVIDNWEKIRAREGLAKMFGQYGGAVPQKGELRLLKEVFGPELVEAVSAKQPALSKMTEAGYQLFNIPRALMASFDVSAPFRQGAFLIGRPKQFWSAFRRMFKVFPSEKAFQELSDEIASRPTFRLMKDSKLALTELDSVLTKREEVFMSQWAEKIPMGVGRMVRASSRAYTGFLNKLRADVFDDLIGSAEGVGLKPQQNPDLLKDLADFINSATGRGSLGRLAPAAKALNTFFFSPRLMASRINLLRPDYYMRLHPFVRKEALKSLLTFAGTSLTVMSLAKMAGAEVETDLRSADSGKIRIGNTRIDTWAGFQQYVRLAAQLIKGQVVSTTTGRIMTLGEGYKPLTRLDILTRAFEYKESPITSFATDLLRGRTVIGEELAMGRDIARRFVPMVVQDMYDLLKEEGPRALPLAALPVMGVGLQTYGPREGTAYYYYEKWSKLPAKEANVKARELKRTDPSTYRALEKIIQYKDLGITPEEEAFSQLGVKDGSRAGAILNHLNKKYKTGKEKNERVKVLRKAKIINDEVLKQIRILIKEQPKKRSLRLPSLVKPAHAKIEPGQKRVRDLKIAVKLKKEQPEWYAKNIGAKGEEQMFGYTLSPQMAQLKGVGKSRLD